MVFLNHILRIVLLQILVSFKNYICEVIHISALHIYTVTHILSSGAVHVECV